MIFNFKNLAENLIITIIVLIVGMGGGYYFSLNAAQKILESQEALIRDAIKKETTNITNTFQTEIKKLKVKKGGHVDLAIEPTLDNDATTIKNSGSDSIPENKQGFFKRLFNKKDKK